MLLAALYATCLIVGVLVGLAGVGGILVPPALILLSGLEPHEAMGTALASFFPVALAGTWLYGRLGQVPRRTALPYMLGGLAALPGALLGSFVPAGPLVALLACTILFAGLCALRPPRPGGGSVFWQSGRGLCAIGAVTGLLAGMTGAGGPVLSIPWMIVVGVSPMTAVGISMPYQVVTALFGTLGNMRAGHVDFSLLPLLCSLELLGFVGGLALARRTPTGMLRQIIGVLCCGLGLFLLLRQVAA